MSAPHATDPGRVRPVVEGLVALVMLVVLVSAVSSALAWLVIRLVSLLVG
jgi:hypothetical protein